MAGSAFRLGCIPSRSGAILSGDRCGMFRPCSWVGAGGEQRRAWWFALLVHSPVHLRLWRRQAAVWPVGGATVWESQGGSAARSAAWLRRSSGSSMAFALDKVREIAERVAHSSGLVLWELELKGSGANRTLRIFIDRPEGVSHEDCSAYSREAATIFDVEDAVPGWAYVLEVSSPGLDRKLFKPEHFARFTGSLIKFSTRELVNG